jgi:hypothetical protein
MDKLSVRLIQQADYRFEILFSDELSPIIGDELKIIDPGSRAFFLTKSKET